MQNLGLVTCTKFREIAAHFKLKKLTSLHFSRNLFWLFQQNLVVTLLGLGGTLSANWTPNDLDLVKLWPFVGSEIAVLHFFFNSISVNSTELGKDIARGEEHLVREFELKRP